MPEGTGIRTALSRLTNTLILLISRRWREYPDFCSISVGCITLDDVNETAEKNDMRLLTRCLEDRTWSAAFLAMAITPSWRAACGSSTARATILALHYDRSHGARALPSSIQAALLSNSGSRTFDGARSLDSCRAASTGLQRDAVPAGGPNVSCPPRSGPRGKLRSRAVGEQGCEHSRQRKQNDLGRVDCDARSSVADGTPAPLNHFEPATVEQLELPGCCAHSDGPMSMAARKTDDGDAALTAVLGEFLPEPRQRPAAAQSSNAVGEGVYDDGPVQHFADVFDGDANQPAQAVVAHPERDRLKSALRAAR